jgi:serine/threonine-protein kinase RsbW
MANETRLTAQCRLDELTRIAVEVRRIAEPVIGPEATALVDLAVTEICSNVVRHSHPAHPEHTFEVVIRDRADTIEIEVRELGPPYSFEIPEMPSMDVDLMDLPEGGFGLAIVAESMDEFERRRDGNINITRMLKRRPQAAAPRSA